MTNREKARSRQGFKMIIVILALMVALSQPVFAASLSSNEAAADRTSRFAAAGAVIGDVLDIRSGSRRTAIDRHTAFGRDANKAGLAAYFAFGFLISAAAFPAAIHISNFFATTCSACHAPPRIIS